MCTCISTGHACVSVSRFCTLRTWVVVWCHLYLYSEIFSHSVIKKYSTRTYIISSAVFVDQSSFHLTYQEISLSLSLSQLSPPSRKKLLTSMRKSFPVAFFFQKKKKNPYLPCCFLFCLFSTLLLFRHISHFQIFFFPSPSRLSVFLSDVEERIQVLKTIFQRLTNRYPC